MQQQQEKVDNSGIKLEDLVNIKKLGFGQFGNVYLTKNKQEKNVMEASNFPFIMKFIRSFKDSNTIYFLLEFIRGMELFDVIRDIGLLGTTDSQYYIATLILCLEYLHSKNIIYRDLKPENIMVNEQGHLIMIDLGTAKQLKSRNQGAYKTFTIIGTPHYMAPEIITGKGYSFAVDLWSVGIIFYEFMCGGVPFAEDSQDPYEIYEEIIKKPVQFPDFLVDKKSKILMLQLLQRTPELRIGGSYAALKANSWFNNFDWDKLYNKELKPPYIPSQNKMISYEEMDRQASKNEAIQAVLQKEKIHSKYKKELAKDQNWDKDF